MSKLFQTASAAQRRASRRAFVAHPSVGLYKSLGKMTAGRGGSARMDRMLNRLTTHEVRDLMRKLNHGRVTKYAKKDDQEAVLQKLLGLLGPIGEVVRAAIGQTDRQYTRNAFDLAADMIRAFGGEVLTKKGQPGYERGLEAAKQLLEEAGYQVIPPGEGEEDAGGIEWGDAAGTAWLQEHETRVSSSNVYSFAWSQETENFGTLYVTFLAWSPGRGKSTGPGSTYAYYGLSKQEYIQFKRAAKSSAGSAVWDYLRVRGSVADHQHPYELVGGVLINKEEVYIPRKATDVGYFRRAVQVARGGRGTWQRSSLPSREFEPERGQPNRGAPNRGR